MENTFEKRFCIDGWWNFEYKVKDMVLTDNRSVYVTDVPDDKIENTLFMVEMLYGKYGSILGDYNIEDETYKTIPITSDNYFNYMYGSGANTNWGTSTTYDDCTLLTTKPVIE